jgi:hypothetical protein
VASLVDAEVLRIAERMDELPAGGMLGFIILVLVIVLLVVVILNVAKQGLEVDGLVTRFPS